MSEMSIDITYIPMRKGFMYLTAIIDVYSRCIMVWGLHNTLEKVNSIEVLHAAVNAYGNPEIINSDQGSQYTGEEWTSTCEDLGIKPSAWMDVADATRITYGLSASGVLLKRSIFI